MTDPNRNHRAMDTSTKGLATVVEKTESRARRQVPILAQVAAHERLQKNEVGRGTTSDGDLRQRAKAVSGIRNCSPHAPGTSNSYYPRHMQAWLIRCAVGVLPLMTSCATTRCDGRRWRRGNGDVPDSRCSLSPWGSRRVLMSKPGVRVRWLSRLEMSGTEWGPWGREPAAGRAASGLEDLVNPGERAP